jgi:ABC-2 type transport system ATP-binding protein
LYTGKLDFSFVFGARNPALHRKSDRSFLVSKKMKSKKKPILSVRNLTKIYKSGFTFPWIKKSAPFVAVDHINFDLKEGEILGLLGPNGAGKTTTIQMLLSTLASTEGSIKYFGKELKDYRSEILAQVSFASTYIRLPHRLTVYENLDVYGRLYGISSNERKFRIKKFLTFFGVWNQRDKLMSGLSAGQTTRVMLAKSFLAYPKVALLDEPTASLDPDISHEVREFVLSQRQEHGVSILFTSHNMDEVTDVCDRVMFLSGGKIIADDTPEKLANSVSTAKVSLIVGDGLKRTVSYCKEVGLSHSIDDRSITIEIDEQEVAVLLMELAKVGVHYSQISIEKPSLEDYFIQLARTGRGKMELEEAQ